MSDMMRGCVSGDGDFGSGPARTRLAPSGNIDSVYRKVYLVY